MISLHDLGVFLDNPMTIVCLCGIGGGLALGVCAWAFTGEYEKGGYESVHKRPTLSKAKPWMLDTDGHAIVKPPDTQAPARHRLDTIQEETTNLGAYVDTLRATARSRVVMIGPEGIIDDEEASRTHRTGETGRVRRAPAERHVEEEERPDSERGELPREAVEDGEEGSAHEEVPAVVNGNARWFRNTVTGEYVFIDEAGRRVEWQA
jgi:hypothetical protein